MTGAKPTGRDGAGAGSAGDLEAEVLALAARWPRALIEQGVALALARQWTASRRVSIAAGRPPFARHALTPALRTALFEARRARRLVRGLEAAEAALETQLRGVRSARAGGDEAEAGGPQRISRLLLVSDDGASRFYRNLEGLMRKYGSMLEVLMIAGDEQAIGAAAFGPDQRARALLLEHKEVVVRTLATLDAFEGA